MKILFPKDSRGRVAVSGQIPPQKLMLHSFSGVKYRGPCRRCTRLRSSGFFCYCFPIPQFYALGPNFWHFFIFHWFFKWCFYYQHHLTLLQKPVENKVISEARTVDIENVWFQQDAVAARTSITSIKDIYVFLDLPFICVANLIGHSFRQILTLWYFNLLQSLVQDFPKSPSNLKIIQESYELTGWCDQNRYDS